MHGKRRDLSNLRLMGPQRRDPIDWKATSMEVHIADGYVA